jgi:DNA/RNA endonuclease YhcR with UshA esterase domain
MSMKEIFLALFVTAFSSAAFCQTEISVDSVAKHLGEKVKICSKVFGTKALDNLTFINVGATYPNSPLTIVILAKDVPNFKEAPGTLYAGKNICVNGLIKEYKGKMEIEVSSPNEIIVQ